MFKISAFHPAKELAYRQDCIQRSAAAQRWLVLLGGGLYAIASLWISFRIGTFSGGFAFSSIGLLLFTGALFGLMHLEAVKPRLEIAPFLFALACGAHIVWSLTIEPRGGAMRFALLFTVLGFYAVLMSPTWRAACLAVLTTVLIAAVGGLALLPLAGAPFAAAEAFSYSLPAFLIVTMLAAAWESSRRESFAMRTELARRATTDELSGVSNRAHINLLAQNEFSRARRYKEPFSVLMLEIDGLENLATAWGPHAAEVVVQVFAGYCVVVMRHCDSFGRLSPHRFLALLPETPGEGAHTLAKRMCRDLSRLDVVVEGETLAFTVSIGVTEMEPRDRWAPEILRRAEQALEDAIEAGRCRAVRGYPPQLHTDDAEESGKVVALTAMQR